MLLTILVQMRLFLFITNIFPDCLSGLMKILLEAAKKSSPTPIDGVTVLLWHVMKGTSIKLHSRAEKSLEILVSKSMVTTTHAKFPDGQTIFWHCIRFYDVYAISCIVLFSSSFCVYVCFLLPSSINCFSLNKSSYVSFRLLYFITIMPFAKLKHIILHNYVRGSFCVYNCSCVSFF
jgi:hypothetical protein